MPFLCILLHIFELMAAAGMCLILFLYNDKYRGKQAFHPVLICRHGNTACNFQNLIHWASPTHFGWGEAG